MLILSGKESDYKIFMQLKDHSDKILFIHPTTSSFYDKLTNFHFVHNEIITLSEQKLAFTPGVTIDEISAQKFKLIKSYSLDFQIKFDKEKLRFQSISPEFAIIWILQTLNSLSMGVALAILEFCNLEILNQHKNQFSSPNALRLLLE